MRAIGGMGAGGREEANFKAWHSILHGGRGDPRVSETSRKWYFPWGDSLGLYNGDSPIPTSYWKVIRLEPQTHSILLRVAPFRNLPSCHHRILSLLERPSRTAGNVSQPFAGSIGQSEKFKSEKAKAEVNLLKLFKGVAANQYFQMCIYHAGREVTHGEQNKHTEIFPFFTVQRVEMEKDDLGVKGRFQEWWFFFF